MTEEEKMAVLESFTKEALAGLPRQKRTRPQDGPPPPTGPAISFEVVEAQKRAVAAEQTRLGFGKGIGKGFGAAHTVRAVGKNIGDDLAH